MPVGVLGGSQGRWGDLAADPSNSREPRCVFVWRGVVVVLPSLGVPEACTLENAVVCAGQCTKKKNDMQVI